MESECMEFLIANHNCLIFSEKMRCNSSLSGLEGMFPFSESLFAASQNYTIFRKGGEFCIKPFKFTTVNWREKFITVWPMDNLDAFSFEFGGCIMSAFEFNGRWFSAHIHMGGNADRYREWNTFIADIKCKLTRLIMFRPDYKEVANINLPNILNDKIRTVGLISSERECFTLYLYPRDDSEKEFRLLAYKEHYAPCNINYYEQEILPYQSVLRASSRSVWDYFFNRMGKSVMSYPDPGRHIY